MDDSAEAAASDEHELDPDSRFASGGPDRASWLDEASQEYDDLEVDEYDIVSSPNDWNFSTMVSFIESGSLKIPAFQRNFIWDRKRASKLIESLLIGLPVPQVFLYEESRNNFIVIDGQQRLLSLYFYYKGRFPRPPIRGELRKHLSEGVLDSRILHDENKFESFKLSLPKSPSGGSNRYSGLTYQALGEDRTSLDLRTIRNIVVKQTSPEGNSAVFEIFSRLNTGGVNLTPQEIRASLYHSSLLSGVLEVNEDDLWRKLVGHNSPDPRMRDTEFLLRSLALAKGLDTFNGSLVGFINKFCSDAKLFSSEQAESGTQDLRTFMLLFADAPSDVFRRTGKFSGVLFEAVFAAWVRLGRPEMQNNRLWRAVETLKDQEEFIASLQEGSTKSVNVKKRVQLAEDVIRRLS